MSSERKKLIVAVALLVVAGGAFWYFNRSGAQLSDSISFVCVASGQTFSISRKDMPSMFPAKNPKTGERTLLPVEERDGKLFVAGRSARLLRDSEQLAKVNKYVDPETLEVLKSPRP